MFWQNGLFLEDEEPSLSITDRGFLLGDGFFETLLLKEGRPVWFAEHWSRLQATADWAFLSIPFSAKSIFEALLQLAQRTNHVDGVARITVSRGKGGRGLGLPEVASPAIAITISALPNAFPSEGIFLTIASEPRSIGGREWSHKAMHFLSSVREMEIARQKGAHDALWVSSQGEVLESTMANVFWVKNEILFTPPANGSILPGIARAKLIECAQTQGIPVREESAHLSVVQGSQTVFLTNSVRGVVPVAHLGGELLQRKHPFLDIFKKAIMWNI